MCLGMLRDCFLRCLLRKNITEENERSDSGWSEYERTMVSVPSALGSRDFTLRPCFPTRHQEDKVPLPFDPQKHGVAHCLDIEEIILSVHKARQKLGSRSRTN